MPAVGHVEEPRARRRGAGERAAHVAEERRLEERLRDAGAVLADERAARARPVGVDGARDELLARAALADEEHRDVARGHAVDEAQERRASVRFGRRFRRSGTASRAPSRASSSSRARRVELGVALAQGATRARARARSARRAARRRRTASRASAIAIAACDATTRTHASSRGPNAPLRTRSSRYTTPSVSPRAMQRHREDAAQAERVDARVHVAERRERVGRHDRVARLDRPARDRLRQGELFADEVVARQVARRARDEAAVGRAQEEKPALDAGPQDHRVEHLLEQRAQPIARRQRADDGLELGDLRRRERDVGRPRIAEARAHGDRLRARPGAPAACPSRSARAAACARARSGARLRRRPRSIASRTAASRAGPREPSGARDVDEREKRGEDARRRRAVPASARATPARAGAPPLPARRAPSVARRRRRSAATRAVVDRRGRPHEQPRRRAQLVLRRSPRGAPRRPRPPTRAPVRRPGRAPRPAPSARTRRPARSPRFERPRPRLFRGLVGRVDGADASRAQRRVRATRAPPARGRPSRSHRSAARVALERLCATFPASAAAAASLVR